LHICGVPLASPRRDAHRHRRAEAHANGASATGGLVARSAVGLECDFSIAREALMRNQPVHWYEGMFLRPQHFQAADRYWHELVATQLHWTQHYDYGLRSLRISAEALANYRFHALGCRARMRDGTIIAQPDSEELGTVDLKQALQRESPITVYLAIPKSALGRVNVGSRDADATARFLEESFDMQDESRGGNDQQIQIRRANMTLRLSTDDLNGFDLLPLARVKRAGAAEATPELDDDFIPPLLAVDAWPPLALDLVRAIYHMIGEKIEVLAQRVEQRGMNLTSQEPGDLDDLVMLMHLNQGHATLRCLAFAQGVHPLIVYSELCRLVGALSIFDQHRRVEEVPLYDHDNLAAIYKWVKLKIERLLGTRKRLDYEQRYFVGTDRGMQVSIEPDWLQSTWQWYVGVNSALPEQDTRDLLRPGVLDWKMGSSQQVDLIFKHGLPGLQQVDLPQPPRALPSRQGWVYYQITREADAWRDVFATQTLALRFRMEHIGNLDRLKGDRKLEVVWKDKRVTLEFALFAVRQG
jgi:type VI secretion system protein ImpJ